MNTSDSRTGADAGNPGNGSPEQGFEHLKGEVTEALGDARQKADAQFEQYRETAADQIEALAQGAKSFVSELEEKDTLGMSDYFTDMAESMSSLAGNLRGKSAEQLLHDGAELARSNPALFIAGSVALGFGLSRFLKAGSSEVMSQQGKHDQAAQRSTPAATGFGAQRPYETSVTPRTDQAPELASSVPPASQIPPDYSSDFAAATPPASPNAKGEL